MTDFEPKWTPGPWSVVERGSIYTVTSPHGNPINCYEVADTWRVKPDADLIALGPEMAEAILALTEPPLPVLDDPTDEVWDAGWRELEAVAVKLRKIGDTHE